MSFLQVINPFGLLFAALLLLPHILLSPTSACTGSTGWDGSARCF